MSTTNMPAVRIERTLSASPEHVFDAWLDAIGGIGRRAFRERS